MSAGQTTILRDGARLRLIESGEGAPVVFQHGLGGDGDQAEQNFPGGAGWRRLTLECRAQGHSEAGPVRPFSIAMFADDVMAAANEAGAGAFVAGGVSMGAAIALRIAVLRPDLVSALVLVRPAWVAASGPANMLPYRAAADAMRRHAGDAATARAAFAASPHAQQLAVTSPDNLASLLGFFGRSDLRVTADLLDGIACDGPRVTQSQITALRLPALVIGNGQDAVHPIATARDLARLIPGARFVEVPAKSADKEAHQAEVRQEIAAFLAGLPIPPSEGLAL